MLSTGLSTITTYPSSRGTKGNNLIQQSRGLLSLGGMFRTTTEGVEQCLGKATNYQGVIQGPRETNSNENPKQVKR